MKISFPLRGLVVASTLLVGGGATVALAVPASAAPAVAQASRASASRTSTKARTTKRARSRGFSGHCESWVRRQFGASSGFPTAMANWRDAVRRGMAHRGDRTPPAGVLVFWNVAGGQGHVGISVGGGRFRDYRGTHAISSMPNYLGWAAERYS